MTSIDTELDGRRVRRDRNRAAVVDAVLGLYDQGTLAPSADEIAVRAGISARSLFRYFDDVDDLVRAAIARQQERLAPRFDHGARLDQPLDERIEAFVAGRTRLLDAMGNVGQVARMRAADLPAVRDELGRIRARLRHQVAELFAAELATAAPAAQPSMLAAADVLCSWEAWHLLRHDQGLSRPAAARAMAAGLRRLVGV